MKDYESQLSPSPLIRPPLHLPSTGAPGACSGPSPPERGAFPARPSSSAVLARRRRVDCGSARRAGRERASDTTGGERAADLERLGGLAGLAFASEADLVGAALPKRRAGLVRAAFELARARIGGRPRVGVRLVMRAPMSGCTCGRASQACRSRSSGPIALDVRHRVLFDELCALGSLTGVEVHPRDIFRRLIKAGAAAVIFCHNHPSGDPTPSRQDIELTSALREVGELCGIAVLDHVVVAPTGYVSLADRNWR